MAKIRITKRFTMETGHALFGYDGPCKNIHGHSYKLYVTVAGEPSADPSDVKHGMVIDFGDLKKIVREEILDKFDHALVLNKNTPHLELGKQLEARGTRVVFADFQPTSEQLVIHFAQWIQKRLPTAIELVSVRLHETDNNYAEWYVADNR